MKLKGIILLIIAGMLAVIYNITLLMVHIASADDELVTTSVVLTILNTFKDTAIFAAILINILLG